MSYLVDDVDHEMAVFAIRVARVEQIKTADDLRKAICEAFPDVDAAVIERVMRYVANRLVSHDLQGE